MDTLACPDDRHDLRSDALVCPDAQLANCPRIAVLLSTFNGERFLQEQLDSLLGQTHREWALFWRDDGSTDGTRGMLRAFTDGAGLGRSLEVGGAARLGATPSFFLVLRAALEQRFDAFAFADQDDVWLPEKLARGVASLGDVPRGQPALYCARQVFVDETLSPIGVSCRLRRQPGFPAALTQNIATGCTMLMNRQAARLVAESHPPAAALHDWWAYVLVAAAGGSVVVDHTPAVLYRQHGRNLVGAPKSMWRRAIAAGKRGPAVFMNVFRQQVGALAEQPHLLSGPSRRQVEALASALRGSMLDRLRVLLGTGGLQRQTWLETLIFRAWFLMG